MNFPSLKSLSTLEISLLIVFVIYLILPIDTPGSLSGIINSPLGMLTLFIVTLYLFFYTHPVLAIIYIFVAYELLRRSSRQPGVVHMAQYTPSQIRKDIKMEMMNPPNKETLEEEIVDKMAPIGHSDVSKYTTSSYKPVSEPVGAASMF